MRKPNIGSISHGTLRNEDLLAAFSAELGWISAGYLNVGDDKAYNNALEVNPDSEEASEVIQDLIDALNQYAPPYCYFGAIEGDWSDFGWWLDHDAIEEAIANSEPGEQPGEYVNTDDGVRIVVSDHGNVEVYALDSGESLLAIV